MHSDLFCRWCGSSKPAFQFTEGQFALHFVPELPVANFLFAQYVDLSPAQIEELERTGQPSRTVTLYAPISGYVTRRGVTQGEKIDSSTTLLDLADLLTRHWCLSDRAASAG